MPTNIDQLQIEIETKSDGAIQGLNKLKETLRAVKDSANSTGLDDLFNKLEKISKLSFNNLKPLEKVGKMVGGASKKVSDLTSDISKVPNTIDITPDTGGVIDAVSDVNQVSDAVNEIPKNTSVDVETSGMNDAQQKGNRLHNVFEKIRTGTNKVSTALQSLRSRLNSVSSAFQRTSKKGIQLSQVLRIVVLYGGAFRAVQMLTKGVAEGLKNVAQYNEETATSMNKLSTMSLYLKNSIGAALYPVIVALTPALQALTNGVVKVFEIFGQLASLLSGKSTYLKAKEYLKEYVDTAKKSAKEIKKSFAGMDEITVIGKKDSKSSDEDYSAMFEEVPINNPTLEALMPFFNGLRTVIASFLETVKGLASDYLYPWLVSLGEWCADNPDTLEKIGKGLGYIAIGIAGLSGAKAILTPIITFFSKVGGFKKGSGILGAISGALMQLTAARDAWANGTSWKNLGKQLAGIGIAILSFSILLGSIGTGISSIVGGIILTVTSVKDWLENGTSWENFLGVMVGLAAIFGGISVLVGSWIPMAIGAVVATVVAIIMWWEEISAFFVNLWHTIIGFFASIGNAVAEFFGGIANWVNDNILQPIIQFFTPFVEAIIGFFKAIWSVISTVFSAIWSVIVTVFTAIYDAIAYVIGAIIDIFVGLGKAIWAVISKIYEIIVTIVQMIWAVVSWLFGLIWDFISNVANWIWDKVLKPVIDFFKNLATKIVDALTSAVNAIKTKVIDPVVNFFKNMVEKIAGFFKKVGTTVVDAISGAFKSVMNGVFAVVEGVVNFFIKGINGAVSIINKIPGVEIKKIDLLQIPRFQTGGFPEDGLFMANHTELIGKFSNGKTAVANNEQIVEGIASGVYAANSEQNGLLREQNKLLRQLVENGSNGGIDVSTITSAMQRKNRRDGKTIIPVGI